MWQMQLTKKNTGGKIIFLTFEVTETNSTKDQYSFKLVKKMITDGRLKKSPYSTAVVYKQNHFYCELTNADS